MSSDDSEFDKEAEREKLREKYERDEEGRENTRRMSELLLQGATMTGKHCNQCGDPIFRYDGQEFCPTCQQEAEGGGDRNRAAGESNEQSSAEAASADVDGGESTPGRTTESSAEDRASDAGRFEKSGGEQTGNDPSEESDDPAASDEPRVEIDGISVADRRADRSDVRRPPSQRDGSDGRARDHSHDAHARGRDARARGRNAHDTHAGGPPRDERATRTSAGASDLGPAREALVRTLTDLARRAEETDDAARARDLLAATREAAEALAALDRVNR